MRRYKVITTEHAVEDIFEIERYISEKFLDPYSAERTKRKIRKEIRSLEITPFRSHLRDNFYAAHVGQYKIVYVIDGNEVRVHNVVHMRRDFRV